MSKAAKGFDTTLTLFKKSGRQLQKAARAAKEAEGKAARTIGAATTKNTRKEGKDVFSVADPKAPGGRRRLRGAAGAKKSGKKDEVRSLTRRGRRTAGKAVAGTGAAVGAGAALTRGGGKKTETKKEQPKAKKFNVGVSKGGVPFNEAFKHFRNKGQKQFTWNGKKYTTELDTEKKKRLETKRKKDLEAKKSKGIKGAVKTILFGKDQVMGGKGGVLDNPLTRPFTKRDEKNFPKKAGGGMMKSKMSSKGGAKGGRKVPPGMKGGGSMRSKMASKGGARGGKRVPPGMMGGGMMKSKMSAKGGAKGGKKMAPGMKVGGMANKKFPDLTGDGKVTQKDILKGRGVPGFSEGGGAKKSKGYAKGGKVMKSKMSAKGGAKGGKKKATRRSKPRGVGVALRGYGKALRKR